MESLFTFLAPPGACAYLPGQTCSLEYEQFRSISPTEYLRRLREGWRRFGRTLFRPKCPACNACRSLRVLVDQFRPDRSQRRNRRLNEREVRLEVGAPAATWSKLRLYDRYHAFQAETKGWPVHSELDMASFIESYVDNPFSTKEYCYYLHDQLVGVGYVDELPGGMSAIYFFYEPEARQRGLGTWNILSILERAAARGSPHVYLGYYVRDCPSLSYKGQFRPHEILQADGGWRRAEAI